MDKSKTMESFPNDIHAILKELSQSEQGQDEIISVAEILLLFYLKSAYWKIIHRNKKCFICTLQISIVILTVLALIFQFSVYVNCSM